MKDDDDFTPRLGRIRSRGSKRGRRYLHQVLRSVALAGGWSSGRSTFRGNRIGRGSGVGRVLAARDRYAAYRARRVIVKSRIVKLKGQGRKAAQLHLRYIQRDGVTREGLPGDLYDAESDRADGRAFLERGEGDRHQFRFIVSAEDAAEYDELKGFTRRLMRQMEEDLGTRLDWVAVDHYNTGHPHTHIVLRGRDDRGKDLVIARDYLAKGMRERAAEIVGLDLGPRSDLEIEHRLRREVEQERFTSLDRGFLRDVGEDGLVRPGTATGDVFRQTLRAGRLQKLRRLELAEEVRPGRWRLADDLEPVLRRMGERGDIIKTMHREMARKGRDRAAAEYAIYDPADPEAKRLVGRVVARGLSDEINDRDYLIVDGVDGSAHYIDIGMADPVSPYVVMAGTAIPASLVTGINSDLPGLVIAQVTGNVYDTPTGRHLLIPQGARLIGEYDSVVAFGQSRALVIWNRIVMPDGSSVVIENLPATDAAGYAGLEDEVDYHTWRLVAGVALSTLLGVGTELTFGDEEGDLLRAIRESAQRDANRAGQRITERNLNIQPTITVRPGWPLRVIVHKDLVLRPYRG